MSKRKIDANNAEVADIRAANIDMSTVVGNIGVRPIGKTTVHVVLVDGGITDVRRILVDMAIIEKGNTL